MELTGVFFGDCEAKQILQFQHSIFPPPVRNYANDMYPYACNSCKPLSANGQVAKQLKTSEPHNGLNEDLKGPLLVLYNFVNLPQRKENEEIDNE